MKKNILLLGIAAFGLVAAWAVGEQSLTINKFGGLQADTDPLALEDGYAQDSENVITDLGSGIQPREGYIAYATSTAKAMWVFAKSNGTRYVIIHNGNSLLADTGAKLFSIGVSTVAAGVVTAGAQLGDYFYFSNSVDGLKRWNGTTTSVANASMTFDKLVTWKGRLVGAGKSGAERTLYLSRYLDGTDWTLEAYPTDDGPAQITVGGALDENITGIFSSFKDILIWFKNNSFGGLYGSRRSNFTLRTISESIGTSHPGTVKDCDGLLRFLGARRTVWQFDGSNLVKISEGNNALFGSILNGESNNQSSVITSKADYDLGLFSNSTSAILEGSIALSTWTATDTTASDFSAGSLTSMGTSGDAIVPSVFTGSSPINNSFETAGGSADVPYAWSIGSSDWVRSNDGFTGTPYDGSWTMYIDCADCASSGTFYLRPENVLFPPIGTSWTIPGAVSYGGSWSEITINSSVFNAWKTATRYVRAEVSVTRSGITETFVSNYFRWDGNGLSFRARRVGDHLDLDFITGGRAYTTNSSFLSRSFDTGSVSPGWLASGGSWTLGSNTLTTKTQTSSDGYSWDTLVSWSTGSAPSSASKRYVRYQIDISPSDNFTAGAIVNDISLVARSKTGTFVSDSKYVGSAASSWSVFQADESMDGGTITYGIYADTDSTKTIGSDGLPVVGTFTSSQTITSNSVPSISTGTYAFVSAKFDIAYSTQNPTNSRLSISWNEGMDLKAKAIWTNQRYWLAASRQNVSENDTIFVFDRRDQWQKYTGMNVVDFLLYNQSPLFSNNSGIFQAETGTTDNNASISSFYTTKYYFPVGPETRGYLRELWMTTTDSDSTLSTSLYKDGINAPLNLGSYSMNAVEGYQVKKLPIGISDWQMARHLAVKWAVSGTENWKILNGSLYFDPDTQRD